MSLAFEEPSLQHNDRHPLRRPHGRHLRSPHHESSGVHSAAASPPHAFCSHASLPHPRLCPRSDSLIHLDSFAQQFSRVLARGPGRSHHHRRRCSHLACQHPHQQSAHDLGSRFPARQLAIHLGPLGARSHHTHHPLAMRLRPRIPRPNLLLFSRFCHHPQLTIPFTLLRARHLSSVSEVESRFWPSLLHPY